MSLIDVDKLIEKIEKHKFTHVRSDYQSGYNDGIFHAQVVADNLPTVDAVPVVRCGICLKKRICSLYRETGDENGFCSWAYGREKYGND